MVCLRNININTLHKGDDDDDDDNNNNKFQEYISATPVMETLKFLVINVFMCLCVILLVRNLISYRIKKNYLKDFRLIFYPQNANTRNPVTLLLIISALMSFATDLSHVIKFR
jgi:hypothetical protein